jgi:hypothetical protein
LQLKEFRRANNLVSKTRDVQYGFYMTSKFRCCLIREPVSFHIKYHAPNSTDSLTIPIKSKINARFLYPPFCFMFYKHITVTKLAHYLHIYCYRLFLEPMFGGVSVASTSHICVLHVFSQLHCPYHIS